MATQTTTYKRSVSGSLGAGFQSMIGSKGRRFYILEHKTSSEYHKLGEYQRIIVDECELGRSSDCQVRFDENFHTVSRKHAAIVKEGEGWKLINLSQTNTTYLNGHPVQKEWYLQNGDEIQLSTNGPKLGFIVPQGKQGLVGSIGLTARMNLFAQQALRPYRTAIAVMALVLVVGGGLGGTIIHKQSKEIVNFKGEITQMNIDYDRQLENIKREDSIRSSLDKEEYKREIARMNREMNRLIAQSGDVATMLDEQKIFKDVYYMEVTDLEFVTNSGKTIRLIEENGKMKGWSGTGFLLSDGRFVTARHCVQGWWFQVPTVETEFGNAAVNEANGQGHVRATFLAVSPSGDKMHFTSDDFVVDSRKDYMINIGTSEDGNPIKWRIVFPVTEKSDPTLSSTDWAYTRATGGKTGDLSMDANLSRNMLPMQRLVVLGYPQGLGVLDGDMLVEPIHNELKTSCKGLASNGCIMHTRGTDHGNSGGPIFTIADGKFVVVGIVSRGDLYSEEYNWAVPIANINNK